MQEFVADRILGGFDLNQSANAESFGDYMQRDNGPNNFTDGPQSATSATAPIAAEEIVKKFAPNQLFHL